MSAVQLAPLPAGQRVGPQEWEFASAHPESGRGPYRVTWYGDRGVCTCPAAVHPGHRRECWHLAAVREIVGADAPQIPDASRPRRQTMQRALAPVNGAPRMPLAQRVSLEPTDALTNLGVGDLFRLAKVLHPSGFLPKSIKSEGEAVAIMLTGQELGVPPMAALRHITVVEGKPNISPELTLALIRRAYGPAAIRIKSTTNEACVVEWRQPGWEGTREYAWTIEDAARAGLTNKDNWRKYPAAMLRARAVAAVARMAFPEVAAAMEIDEPSAPPPLALAEPAAPLSAPQPLHETGRPLPETVEGFCAMCGARETLYAPGTIYDSEDGAVCVDRVACRARYQARNRAQVQAANDRPEIFLDDDLPTDTAPPMASCAICGHRGPCVDDGEADVCRDQAACAARVTARDEGLRALLPETPQDLPAPAEPKPAPGRATAQQLHMIAAHLTRTGLEAGPLLDELGVSAFEALSQPEASGLLRDLSKRPNAAPASSEAF